MGKKDRIDGSSPLIKAMYKKAGSTYCLWKGRPRKKGYVVCRRNEDGQIECLVELSFWMGWSLTQCRIWSFPPLHHFDPANGEFMVRIHSKKSPIHIDLKFQSSKYNTYFWPIDAPKYEAPCTHCGTLITANDLIWVLNKGNFCPNCPNNVFEKEKVSLALKQKY